MYCSIYASHIICVESFSISLALLLGTIPAATTEDVDIAVNAARAAFNRNKGQYWARTSGKYRAKFLRAIAAKVPYIFLPYNVIVYRGLYKHVPSH